MPVSGENVSCPQKVGSTSPRPLLLPPHPTALPPPTPSWRSLIAYAKLHQGC